MIITAQVTPRRRKRRRERLDLLKAQAVHAMGRGAINPRKGVVFWPAAGDCEDPIHMDRWARPPGWADRPEYIFYGDGFDQKPLGLDMLVRCRRCPRCLKARARAWAYRAKAETAASPRTWFATLTLNPAAHWRVQLAAMARLTEGGTIWETLSPDEQFLERHREISIEITKFLKRVRKNSGAPMRYILVAEAHKSGLPHYHLLVHEVDEGRQVRHRDLTDAWSWGHSRFKLVEGPQTAWYVCKYLSKAQLARVRASVRYGKTP